MKLRTVVSVTLASALAACSDHPSSSLLPDQSPSFARAPADPGIALTFDDALAGARVTSDGRSATVLGVSTASSYANGQCGVDARLNLTDAVATLAANLTNTQKATCSDKLGTGRRVRFALDSPVNAGDPVFATVSVPYHMKINSVQNVTTSAYLNGGWGRISSRDPRAGDCEKIRFSTVHGADPLLVTRTRTKGVGGSDRNEWTVEAVAGADRAACLDANLKLLRYYRLPVKLTVTQVTY